MIASQALDTGCRLQRRRLVLVGVELPVLPERRRQTSHLASHVSTSKAADSVNGNKDLIEVT